MSNDQNMNTETQSRFPSRQEILDRESKRVEDIIAEARIRKNACNVMFDFIVEHRLIIKSYNDVFMPGRIVYLGNTYQLTEWDFGAISYRLAFRSLEYPVMPEHIEIDFLKDGKLKARD